MEPDTDSKNDVVHDNLIETLEVAEAGNSVDAETNDQVSGDGSDSEFGSFDDASFEEHTEEDVNQTMVSTNLFEDPENLSEQLIHFMETMFPQGETAIELKPPHLLSDTSEQLYRNISKLPKLKSSGWIRLNTRRDLLIRLGLPVNLDELTYKRPVSNKSSAPKIDIPDLSTYNLTDTDKKTKMKTTDEYLAKVESEILSNTSANFLANSSEEFLQNKLTSLKNYEKELLMLSLIWEQQLTELTNDYKIYEDVVQNYVGYSHKVRIEELQNLKKKKKK